MIDKAFRAFIRYATKFLVNEGLLFRRAKLNMPPRRVIWDRNEQNNIIQQLHDESGHRDKKGTYQKVALQYWWKGLYCNVEKWVKTCQECQKRSPIRVTEELHPTLDNVLWQRVGLDVIHMLANEGFSRIVAMKEYLSGWVETKALRNADSKSVAAFIHKWIVRFGVPGIIIHDNGAENQKIMKVLIKRHCIKNISIATYHPQWNTLVERGHQQIVDGLAKLGPKWVKNLPLVLWADRITTRVSMGFTPYRLVFGQDCILPIELTAVSWATVNWNRIKTRAELLAVQARQLERKEQDVRKGQENIRKSRLRNKAYFDKN